MADIRFKICGSKPPFLINVHEDSCTGPLVCSTTLEYSGDSVTSDACYTCAIISNLKATSIGAGTCKNYFVCIHDSIGKTDNVVFPMPVEIVPPPPTIKTISLGGTVITESTAGVQYLSGSKNLIIDPPLESGECFCLDLYSVAFASDENQTSQITIYKSCNGGVYQQISNLVGDDDGETSHTWVCMRPNDSVCYNMSSQSIVGSSSGTYTADACLSISDTGNTVGIDEIIFGTPNLLNVCQENTVTTTTTTTTQIPTVDVYFNGSAVSCSTTGSQDLNKYRSVSFNNIDSSQTAKVDLFINGIVTKTNGLNFSTVLINYRTNTSSPFEPKDTLLFKNKFENIENKSKTLTFNGITSNDDLEIQIIIINDNDNFATVEMTLTNPQLTVPGTGPSVIQITNPNPPTLSNTWIESI